MINILFEVSPFFKSHRYNIMLVIWALLRPKWTRRGQGVVYLWAAALPYFLGHPVYSLFTACLAQNRKKYFYNLQLVIPSLTICVHM